MKKKSISIVFGTLVSIISIHAQVSSASAVEESVDVFFNDTYFKQSYRCPDDYRNILF